MTALTTIESTAARLRRSTRVRLLWMLAALTLVVVLGIASTMIGSRGVDLADVIAAYGGSATGFDQAAVAKRIPRTLLAVCVGAALGVSGAVMQGVTRNPLADPGILGVNTGASLAVVIGIAYFGLASATQYIWFAIIGAAITAVFVYTIGSLGRQGATPLKLALAGAATAAALTSFISAVVLPRGDISDLARDWQIGGVGGVTMSAVILVGPFLLAGFLICIYSAPGLNALALGDELAAGLGQHVGLTRLVSAAGAVVLCGGATAVAGPIGFLGLVIPHACRLLIGVDHRWLIPFSAVTGAGLLTASDILGRIIARPAELDVGILTALIGAPFFIAIVRRQKVRSL
ncbi:MULTISPECIES: FecCD family ABC transporter permease [unclassified Brevibacterium]|uniref:FecCD family ABC transporter permease n=1 Tax=unclassified Brevibacterium TaxID=2614124 RepID=UPI001081BC7B|nr:MULTISPECIES: iron ABC transporter permease [unclassified Brevibacterium]TGD13668.1 iron ABC transporter permease [Brevibacterium sp. S111]TGD27988.1 iron ABC transporter permease [Brevibacterium sp. S22]